jgi:hypothetical protein
MNIDIRQADLEFDRKLLIETLLRYLTPLSDDRRFDWLYRNNPHGEARGWIAIDRDNGAIVGMAGAFPRRVYVEGREKLGWVLGDFCVDDQYRSLGPALRLQRACLAEVDSGAVAFCYDFPSVSMMAVYRRLSINPFGQMLRLAKPLRIDRKIGEVIKTPVVARELSAVGNFLLTLHDSRPRDSRALTMSLHEGHCGEEFSALAREVGSRYGVCIQRSAEYLNWRYLGNPFCRYELLTARRDGALLAYAVFTHAGEDATLVDLFAVDEPRVISRLVDGVVALLRKRGAVTLSAPVLESHPWVPLLQRLGFKAREARPMIVYAPPCPSSKRSVFEGSNWFLMHGDRDS